MLPHHQRNCLCVKRVNRSESLELKFFSLPIDILVYSVGKYLCLQELTNLGQVYPLFKHELDRWCLGRTLSYYFEYQWLTGPSDSNHLRDLCVPKAECLEQEEFNSMILNSLKRPSNSFLLRKLFPEKMSRLIDALLRELHTELMNETNCDEETAIYFCNDLRDKCYVGRDLSLLFRQNKALKCFQLIRKMKFSFVKNPLYDAAASDDQISFQLLLENISWDLMREYHNKSILHLLPRISDPSIDLPKYYAILVYKGADINDRAYGGGGSTPLMEILCTSHQNAPQKEEIAEFFIANGANLYARNRKSENIFFHACRCSKKLFDMILMNCSAVNVISDYNQNLLHVVAEALANDVYDDPMDGVEIMKILVQRGVSVNLKDEFGNTPMIYLFFTPEDSAWPVPNEDIILQACQVLIESGADPGIRCNGGYTCVLEGAVDNCFVKVALFLLEHPNAVPNKFLKRVPCELVDHFIFQFLRNHGNHKIAFEKMFESIIKQSNFDINAQTENDGQTFLHKYFEQCHTRAKMYLQESSGYIYDICRGVPTSVSIAKANGNRTMRSRLSSIGSHIGAKLFIEEGGADIYVQDNNGHTPLSIAIEYGDPDLLNYLSSIGANIDQSSGIDDV